MRRRGRGAAPGYGKREVNEAFRLLRQIVIHDVRDVVDVNAAGGYVDNGDTQ